MALPPILSERLKLPIIAAPLFIISNPDLVIAQCKAGIVGSFPALNRAPSCPQVQPLCSVNQCRMDLSPCQSPASLSGYAAMHSSSKRAPNAKPFAPSAERAG